jgi:hypothetical protein
MKQQDREFIQCQPGLMARLLAIMGKTLRVRTIGENHIAGSWRLGFAIHVAIVVCECLMEIGSFDSLGTSEIAIRPRRGASI